MRSAIGTDENWGTIRANINTNPQGGLVNVKPSSFSRIRAKCGQVRSGIGNAVIAAQGDSIVRGTGSGQPASNGTDGYNGILKQMEIGFIREGLTALSENLFGYGGYEQAFATYDNRVTVSGSFNRASGGGLRSAGGQIFQASATGVLTYTPVQQGTTFDIYYLDNGASFTTAIDGGSAVAAPGTGNTSAIRKVSIEAGSLGSHSIALAWTSGQVYVLGIEFYNSAAKRLSLLNWGWHGSKVGDLADAAQGFWSADRAITSAQVDLLIWGYSGTNDWRNSVSAAAVMTAIDTQIDRYMALASPPDILFVTAPPDGNSVGLSAAQQDYIDGVIDYAVANNFPVYDRWRRWRNGNEAAMEIFGAMNTDKLHPTRAGYAMDAAELVRGILYA